MKLLLLFTLVAVAFSHHLEALDGDHEWELFKIEHEKEYESEVEEQKRKVIFLKNLHFIHQHNAKYEKGEVTFNVAINRFADMSGKEFAKTMNGLRIPAGYSRTEKKFDLQDTSNLPRNVDWRSMGAVTEVKDQLQCGSCYAFSTTGSIEGQRFRKTGKLVSLSEQNVVDCSSAEGNQGCNGGLMDYAFKYVKVNGGIDSEASYPYVGQVNDCQYNAENKSGTVSGFIDITSGSELAVQAAVANVGPISVAIDASHDSFQFYSSGVYNEPACSSTELDHAMLLVGYRTPLFTRNYWWVKNSWGTSWGMKGYIMMARNKDNMCGIATMASYPLV